MVQELEAMVKDLKLVMYEQGRMSIIQEFLEELTTISCLPSLMLLPHLQQFCQMRLRDAQQNVLTVQQEMDRHDV